MPFNDHLQQRPLLLTKRVSLSYQHIIVCDNVNNTPKTQHLISKYYFFCFVALIIQETNYSFSYCTWRKESADEIQVAELDGRVPEEIRQNITSRHRQW
jgi:hypothetical protein